MGMASILEFRIKGRNNALCAGTIKRVLRMLRSVERVKGSLVDDTAH